MKYCSRTKVPYPSQMLETYEENVEYLVHHKTKKRFPISARDTVG